MQHYVYILASRSRALYTGMTCDLVRRVWQHRTRYYGTGAHTSFYRIHRLVYFEVAPERRAAAARERQIKAWTRAKRVALIERENPAWDDLARGWFEGS